MEVILLENVRSLGNLGDKVKVKPGYGRNYLIPTGKALPATKDNLTAFEARRAELEQQQRSKLASAGSRAEALAGISVTIPARVGDQGRLFGSVGSRDIAEALTAAGVSVSKHEVHLPAGPLRLAGEHEVEVVLHGEIAAHVKVLVVSQT